MSLAVDVISDVICPWCYLGKRRLEKAVAALGGPVKVRWLPFQLNPTMPKEGISRREYRTRKFGTWERSLELDARVIEVGKSEGVHFAFDRIERTPNTEALFRAYFTEGRDIGNRQTLLDVVGEAGLDRHQAEAVLSSDDGMEAITEAGELARRIRVDGVPFFIVNGKVTLGGAQPPGAFLEAFGQALSQSNY
jgi:predicted DsbA family dithiol-disulfide isomerase